jgi:tetratricopeptide (TPR) repeat protein
MARYWTSRRPRSGLCRCRGVTGRSKEAIPRCKEAIAVARAVGARAEEAKALRILGGCLEDLGELDRAITLGLEARRIAEEVGDAETVVNTYTTLHSALELAGREHDALEDTQQSYQRAREFGLERAMGSFVATNLAHGLLITGRWQECERLTRELLTGDSWGAFAQHEVRGVLLIRRGELLAAREQLDLALRLSPRFYRDLVWLGLAELALWEGRHDEAGTAIAKGLRWCAERDPDGALPNSPAPGMR